MRNITVLIILISAILLNFQTPCQAGVFTVQKAKIEQNKIHNNNVKDIKSVIEKQDLYANMHNRKKLEELYSKDFVNADGFNKEAYFKLIDETWESYPDISYKTEIKNIEFTDNYATVFVKESAVATSVEEIGKYKTVGELYSVSKCVYHLEKHGMTWLISSEKVIEETSTLKFGEARYMNVELNAPKQIGSNRNYTVTLKADVPKNSVLVASISREKIIYPQTKSEDAFRKINDNVLERVFLSNNENVNEYAMASVGITHAENFDNEHIRVYMDGLAFIMTRINVVPENKYINLEEKDGKGK